MYFLSCEEIKTKERLKKKTKELTQITWEGRRLTE